jgi:hypothetical protein
MIYVANKPNLNREMMYQTFNMELITIKIGYPKSKPFYLSCVYRTPDDLKFIESYEIFINEYKYTEHIVVGDFNYDLYKKRLIILVRNK